MKCKDCGKEKNCPGLHTGPHKNCFRQKTNADRIREMTDAELELFLPNWSYTNAAKLASTTMLVAITSARSAWLNG